MKRPAKFLLIALVLLPVGVVVHLLYLRSLNGDEHFPQDEWLNQADNKTALIVVAHDDDAISCAGTVSNLTRSGWKVYFLTFYGHWRMEDNPIRKLEVAKAAAIQQLSGTQLVDFALQKFDTASRPWYPVPYDSFSVYLQLDSLKEIVQAALVAYRPSVVFTLDDSIGGYGHPEHVCVSQCVLQLCRQMKDSGSSTVQRVYQPVFTKTLSEHVLSTNEAYIAAKQVYGVSGMPQPDVAVNIAESMRQKKEVMLAYDSQKRNLKRYWPWYDWYPYWLYFRIYDQEYFRVVVL